MRSSVRRCVHPYAGAFIRTQARFIRTQLRFIRTPLRWPVRSRTCVATRRACGDLSSCFAITASGDEFTRRRLTCNGRIHITAMLTEIPCSKFLCQIFPQRRRRVAARAGNMRLFVATLLSPEIHDRLWPAVRRIQAELSRAPVKWVAPENIHLTYRFLGETPETDVPSITDALLAVCANFSALNVRIAGLGCFPSSSSPKVLWVGLLDTDELAKLNQAIQVNTARFGQELERLSFSPHLTIGRVKTIASRSRRRLGQDLKTLRIDDIGPWRIEHVSLVQSELSSSGSRYHQVMSIPLSGR